MYPTVGELNKLEWLVKGKPMHSSWATPEDGMAVTHLDLTLKAKHDFSDLVCRLSTLTKLPSATTQQHFYYETPELTPSGTTFPEHDDDEGKENIVKESKNTSAMEDSKDPNYKISSPGEATVRDSGRTSKPAGDKSREEETITDVSILIQMYCE